MTKGPCDICGKTKPEVSEFKGDFHVIGICGDCLKED